MDYFVSDIGIKENIFKDVSYEGFWLKIPQILCDAIERYWEVPVRAYLHAVNDYINLRDDFLVKNMDFFSGQIKVEHHKPVIIRLDRDFVKDFLDISLDTSEKNFKLNNLTPLEIKILNNFCEFLYKQINEILLPVKEVKMTARSEKNINLTFAVKTNNENFSKIIISIPQDRIDMVKLKHEISFTDEDFLSSVAYVKIRVGYSKLRLEELQGLAQDDIVLLEGSKLNELTLLSGEYEKKFNVKVDESLILKLENNQSNGNEINNEVVMTKNLWDDIEIELNAEFSKVKMTIGELKQITKGQIVDLGSIFNNEISLYIEDKKIASGELMVINDKYAVRLNEVLSSDVTPMESNAPEPQAPKGQASKPQSQPKPQPKPQPKAGNPAQNPTQNARPKPAKPVEDEEFDYSDFEN